MRIGIVKGDGEPVSFERYRENVTRHLGKKHELLMISSQNYRDDCDVLWHPGLGGARRVPNWLKQYNRPLVVTMHGTVPFSTPLRYLKNTKREIAETCLRKIQIRNDWRLFSCSVSSVIAVSEYSKLELKKFLYIPEHKIVVINHGVDCKKMDQQELKTVGRKYILHVSSGGKRKNVSRLIEAYSRLPENTRPDLLIVGHEADYPVQGVMSFSHKMSHAELFNYYDSALFMVMPSLEESFGLPIIEAMACGCPVITSKGSGCEEIAGGAALLVDPYSVDSLYKALDFFLGNFSVRKRFSNEGINQSKKFDWAVCAAEHEAVFVKASKSQATGAG